jgi:putative glutamine amidotransferase
MTERIAIGLSGGFLHADADRAFYRGKTLQYIEQSLAGWVASEGALTAMLPLPEGELTRFTDTARAYADWLDGLVLMGGSDVWPGHYGEAPLRPQWTGDRLRDRYEIALIEAFVGLGKPVFGICRGMQLINVAFGGSLLQDIATQRPHALSHRDEALYDRHFHSVELVPGSRLAELYPGLSRVTTNSVHHQAVNALGSGLEVEAHCPDDQTVEALRWRGPSYVAAVQWHPEFHAAGDAVLDDRPILRDFLASARAAQR